MIIDRLTSIQLYTEFPPGSVQLTRRLQDVGSAMYPCYYVPHGAGFKVSTSVASLILDAGAFDLNPRFTPPQFALHPWKRELAGLARKLAAPVDELLAKVKVLRAPLNQIKATVPATAKTLYWNPHQASYDMWETIDRKIWKLRSFQAIGADGATPGFASDLSLRSLDELVAVACAALQRSVNEIERRFPGRMHVILTGGKDSQLIGLIPKLNPERWCIFSAEPNFRLVERWVAENDIPVARVIRHDGRNEETRDDFKRKIMCGDLYTSPAHIRYCPTLKRLAAELGDQCIFWVGSMPRGAHLFDGRHHRHDRSDPAAARSAFFNAHLAGFPAWQGNLHQTYANFVGHPFLCPYDLEEIWEKVYRRLDPLILTKDADLRGSIGDRLLGRPVKWPDENPGPMPYSYPYFWFSPYKYYVRHIRRALAAGSRAHR
jgi:hypothetical protein